MWKGVKEGASDGLWFWLGPSVAAGRVVRVGSGARLEWCAWDLAEAEEGMAVRGLPWKLGKGAECDTAHGELCAA